MPGSFTSSTLFLIKTIFNLYLFVILVRILLQFFNAHRYNSISNLIIKLTQPLVKPCRRFLRIYHGVDLALIVIGLIVVILKLFLVLLVSGEASFNIFGLFVLGIGDLLSLLISIFFFSIIISVVLSWISSPQTQPLAEITYVISEPLLRPIRRFIPLIAGFDLSPIFALIILQLLQILIVSPLKYAGLQLLL